MKLKTISCQAVKNRGNYESERFEASAEIEEGEDVRQAALYLRRWVHSILSEPLEMSPLVEEDS